ncbi:MAG: hypothetical protein PHQ28_16800 [Mycobacterium sp.]|nr:hypothetical protein [Mycobacterium sp.]
MVSVIVEVAAPAASNQAERDLRSAKVQQNISGRLTSEARYRICGYLSTAVKHGNNASPVLRDAIIGRPWVPPGLAPRLTNSPNTNKPARQIRA